MFIGNVAKHLDIIMKIKKQLSLLAVFITASSLSFSQENKPHAEELFNRTSNLGVYLSLNQDIYNNRQNSLITFEYRNINSLAFGVDYNFYQKGKFNFRTGFYMKNSVLNEFILVPPGLNGLTRQFELDSTDGPNWTYHLPIMVDYVAKINEHIFFMPSLGYEVTHYGFTEGTSETRLSLNDQIIYNGLYTEVQKPFTGGFNFELGVAVDLKNNFFMKFNAKYHRNNTNIAGETIQSFDNDRNLTAVSASTWTGHYWQFGISLYPPAGWLKSKSKK